MYGYESRARPPEPTGGCGEFRVLTRAAFEVLLPPVIAISVVLGLLMTTIFLLLSGQPWLALFPMTPIVIGLTWMVRRDKRLQREMEAEARGEPPPD